MQVIDTGAKAGTARTRACRIAPVRQTPEASRASIIAMRQDFLDAMPVAAAMLERKAEAIRLIASNPQFDRLAPQPGGDVVAHFGLDTLLGEFLASGAARCDLPLLEGNSVGGRHFEVRLSRLMSSRTFSERCLISMLDRTGAIETERSLRAEMLHDSLTGLPNRLAFDEAVEAAIAAGGAEAASIAVLVVDLTRFSRVNECMGSIAGDELIITVARRLVSALRQGDVLARIGGNEFAILLHLSDGPGDALHAGRRIQAALSTPFRLTDLEIRIDCAVGCALVSDQSTLSEDLVRNAQFALKRAKRSGRVEVYQPGEVTAARRRFSLETELRRAIEADRLELHYQPLVDLESGAIAGFEALARWTPDEGGPISPSEFIPVAEESGLIVPLGRWALATAANQLAEWDRMNGGVCPFNVSVNVSAVQVQRDDVVAVVRSVLDNAGIVGGRLKLELTESCIIADPDRASRVMHALKELDVRIAMDDFGTGYSSLAYLQRLPIDVLKIDRSFVTPMLADRDSVAIVRAVLSLADALGMRTTAEGVETVELAQTLAALGCTLGQGYYFGRPVPAAATYEMWRARSA